MKKITKEHRVLDDTDLNNINNTFELFKSELQSSREELKYSREGLNGKLNFILWFIGLGFAVLGILIKMS
jgi:hypothetical protein